MADLQHKIDERSFSMRNAVVYIPLHRCKKIANNIFLIKKYDKNMNNFQHNMDLGFFKNLDLEFI